MIDESINRLRSYTQEIGRGYLWQQPFVCDKYTVALSVIDDRPFKLVEAYPSLETNTAVL